MTPDDDPNAEMRHDDLDLDLTDRLLGGELDPADAPQRLAGVIALMRAAGGPPAGDELAGQRAMVEAMAATEDAPGVPFVRRKPVLLRAHSTRAAAVVALAALGVGAAAAAVTANRPSDRAAGPTTEPIVVTVAPTVASTTAETPPLTPETTPPETTTTSSTTSTTTAAATAAATAAGGRGPDATGPAAFGLCTALLAHQRSGADPNGVAFENLDAAAAAAGMATGDYCAAVVAARDAALGDTEATRSAAEKPHPRQDEQANGSGDGRGGGPPPDVPGASAPGRGRP
jgi:hypothetical protein